MFPAEKTTARRLLLLVPYFNREGVGEDYANYRWIRGLAERHEVTVLALSRAELPDRERDLPAELIELSDSRWHETLLKRSAAYARFSQKAAPNYVTYYRKARRWLEAHGERFDLIHQFSPLALRYPSPAVPFAREHRIPFVVGPLAGSLPTPDVFRPRRTLPELRRLDLLRFRLDPWLRATYAQADCVIGAAPYVEELLRSVPLRRFEVLTEIGVDPPVQPPAERTASKGLRLLFVGRLIETKGLLHAVRALSFLRDVPDLNLRIVGDGPLRAPCAELIRELDLSERVEMVGRLAHADALREFQQADVFLFPSYREPSGHVVYEALAAGLPVITSDRGGPAYAVDESCGFRVPVGEVQDLAQGADAHEAYAQRLAERIRTLNADRARLERMREGARARHQAVALWEGKFARMSALYESVLEACRSTSAV